MEKCAKLLVGDNNQVQSVIGEIPCTSASPTVIHDYAIPYMNYIWWAVAIITVITLLFKTLYVVKQQRVKVIERFGKFKKIVSAGLHFKVPFIDRIAGDMTLKVNQLTITVETKTKDNVFVQIPVVVQLRVNPDKVNDAFYKLVDDEKQIGAYVFDAVRAQVPTMVLDDVFEKKNDIATNVKKELDAVVDEYGYIIVGALVTDISPDAQVRQAMNEIQTQTRLRAAVEQKAEADKMVSIKHAEAESESKKLQGEGIANQRKAIIEGLKSSVKDLSDATGIKSDEVMQTIMLTQYFDTLKEMGASKVILLPSNPGGVADLGAEIRKAIIGANETK